MNGQLITLQSVLDALNDMPRDAQGHFHDPPQVVLEDWFGDRKHTVRCQSCRKIQVLRKLSGNRCVQCGAVIGPPATGPFVGPTIGDTGVQYV